MLPKPSISAPIWRQPGIGIHSSCLFRSFRELLEASACLRRLIWRAVARKPGHSVMRHALTKCFQITRHKIHQDNVTWTTFVHSCRVWTMEILYYYFLFKTIISYLRWRQLYMNELIVMKKYLFNDKISLFFKKKQFVLCARNLAKI